MSQVSSGPRDLLRTAWGTHSPQVLFTGAVQLGRGAIAFVTTVLSIAHIHQGYSQEASGTTILAALLGALVFLLGLTTTVSLYIVLGPLRANRMPAPWLLTFSGVLDYLWIVLGWMSTGYDVAPYPVLLVVAIGIHGVLLGPLRTGALTLIGAVFFLIAYQLAPPLISESLGTDVQVALIFGAGILSAVVGNRIRAANWMVERLRATLVRIYDDQERLIQHFPVGLVLFGSDATVVAANPRALALGAGHKDGFAEWLRTELPEVAEAVMNAIFHGAGEEGGEARSTSGRYYVWRIARSTHPNLAALPTAALAAPISAGEPGNKVEVAVRVLALLTLHDVTEERRVEEARRRAEHFEQVAELSAGLAHEIRNPLAALRSAAEQLQEITWNDPVDERLTRVVVREADRLNRLVTTFLDFARVGRGEYARHSIRRLIEDSLQVVSSLAKERDVTIRLDVSDTALLTDADLFFRALSNLFLNAVTFAPEGSTVDVTAEIVGANATVRVRDRGVGVRDDDRARIFRPFVTGRTNGVGLGLAIAARAASLLGGSVTVETPDDGGPGACFAFTIPLEPVSTSQ